MDFNKKRGKTTKTKKEKHPKKSLEPSIDLILDEEPEEEQEPKQAPSNVIETPDVVPFKDGIVNSVFEHAESAHWIKSEETNLLWESIETVHQIEGTFIGDISLKTSFIKNNKGVALL